MPCTHIFLPFFAAAVAVAVVAAAVTSVVGRHSGRYADAQSSPYRLSLFSARPISRVLFCIQLCRRLALAYLGEMRCAYSCFAQPSVSPTFRVNVFVRVLGTSLALLPSHSHGLRLLSSSSSSSFLSLYFHNTNLSLRKERAEKLQYK